MKLNSITIEWNRIFGASHFFIQNLDKTLEKSESEIRHFKKMNSGFKTQGIF